ncbi:MAG TPA: hypothetical protein VGM39_02405 [Kofleriaceae bacterium]
MAKKPLPIRVTKAELLGAVKAVKREKLKALSRELRPGKGLAEVTRAINALPDEPDRPQTFCLPLAQALSAHEPWDEHPYKPLEPLFDAARVLAHFWDKAPKIKNPVADEHCTVVRGDLHVRRDLHVKGMLVVCGSLRVDGAIHNYGSEWWSGTLIVLGDVTAKRMLALGPTAIGGTLRLSQGACSAYYHDNEGLLVARKIIAPIWFERGDHEDRIIGLSPPPLRFEPWLHERLPKYFNEHDNVVAWRGFDAKFFKAARAVKPAKKRRR